MSKEQPNIPADFWNKKNVTLDYMEEGIRAVEGNKMTAEVILAISFGRIRRDNLFIEAGYKDFKSYVKAERTYTKYKQAIKLSRIGLNWWEYNNEMAANGVKLTSNMSKVALLHLADFHNDPLFWEKFNSFSVEKLERYMRDLRDEIHMYPAVGNGSDVKVQGASILLNGVKVKGLNLNEARKEIAQGKRAVVVWVHDENEARRVRRRVEG